MALLILPILLPLVAICFFVVFIVLWIKMIIHAASKPIPNKIAWILVICLLNWLGSVIYYFAVYKKYKKGVLKAESDETPVS